jgi:predicted HD superfamily hydrolase involved in NAD metabolism
MSAITYDRALAAVRSRLSAGAASHSERVGELAADLAGVYGVNPAEARLAGLLHDWHRETGSSELLERAGDVGVTVTEIDEAVPYLLHAPIAACDLAAEFPGIGSDITSAVGAHTYGAPQMSALAKTVYVADVIEPSRGSEHAAELRAAVGKVTLDELFARTYTASLVHLIETRRRLHPVTVEVYNRYVAGVRP